MPDNYADQTVEQLQGLLADRVYVECPPPKPQQTVVHGAGLCAQECDGTGKRWLLRKPCRKL